LRESEARANQIIELAPDAILVVDPDGRIARTNLRMRQMLGYDSEELLGQSVELLMPERFRAGHHGSLRGYFMAPKARFMGEGRDLFACSKDGGEVAVEIGLAPLETAQGRMVLANIVDISERLRAKAEIEAALKEKILLLNEIHHRVKNNLQIVASLLSLQAGRVSDPAFSALIAESEGRVRAMALMH
jgi:PAS domain S-box-containing protein